MNKVNNSLFFIFSNSVKYNHTSVGILWLYIKIKAQINYMRNLKIKNS